MLKECSHPGFQIFTPPACFFGMYTLLMASCQPVRGGVFLPLHCLDKLQYPQDPIKNKQLMDDYNLKKSSRHTFLVWLTKRVQGSQEGSNWVGISGAFMWFCYFVKWQWLKLEEWWLRSSILLSLDERPLPSGHCCQSGAPGSYAPPQTPLP